MERRWPLKIQMQNKQHVTTRAEATVMRPQAGDAKSCGPPPEAGRGPLRSLRKNPPCRPLTLDFRPVGLGDSKFLLSPPWTCGT